MKVNILGTPYDIAVKNYDEEEVFDRRHIAGYTDKYTHKIIICNMNTYKGWEHEPPETCANCQKLAVRHEIVHAFFMESGLDDNAFCFDGAWCENEEMVDWIAQQGEKIYAAWKEADAL